MSEKNRVVVTGMGVTAPNGIGVDAFQDALYSGKSGIKHWVEYAELNFRCQIGGIPELTEELKKENLPAYFNSKIHNRGILYALLAGLEAMKDSGLEVDPGKEDEDFGIVFGSGSLGLDSFLGEPLFQIVEGENRKLGSRIIPQCMNSGAAAYLNQIIGFGNVLESNSSACCTGSEAVLMGYERIQSGKAKRMLCGSTEGDGKFIWGAFDAMRVLCSDSNDSPDKASRPMSATSSGFVPGGGSGALILESYESAKARGATIYAEIKGGFKNTGGMRRGGSMTAPNPLQMVRCITGAVADADVDPKEIDLINGHLTSTKGDPLEIESWQKALNLEISEFPMINTPKSLIGHLIAGAGSVELVASLIQLKNQKIHANYNLEEPHPQLSDFFEAGKIPVQNVEKEINYLAKANFGFGDVNCCLILKNWSHE